MAAVWLPIRAPDVDDPSTSIPATKTTALGSTSPATMSSAPVTRNMGRQRVRIAQAKRASLGAPKGSAGPADGFHATRFQRSDRLLIAASFRKATGPLLLCDYVHTTLLAL